MRKSLLLITCLFGMHFIHAQSSVLAEGTWYKIGITETGIYKIDRTTLDVLGISNNVDPRKIKIYGNGVKGVLPQANSETRPEDLQENAIHVVGEADGSFGQNDYILFYGVGPNKEEWTESGFAYEKNFYSDTAFYFIQTNGENGKRISTKASDEGSSVATVSTFNDQINYEEDFNNLISSGRGWYGERLNSGESQNFSHEIDGLSSSVEIVLNAVSQSSEDASFNVSTGSGSQGSIQIASVPDGPGALYSIKASQKRDTFDLGSNATINLEIEFDGNASGERGYIDYYVLLFERSLRLYNSETHFRTIDHIGELVAYEVSNASGASIWDVTDPINVQDQSYSTSGNSALFKSQNSVVEEYVVFEGTDFPTPFVFGSVPNQNIRGITNFDGIIVTYPGFLEEAQTLAQFHQTEDGLNVQVVTTTQVYNEFSSGRQDVSAIRDYAKYLYEQSGSLKYLLLFGDCSYDYKDRINRNTNYVPTYESRDSFHPIFSHSSDDYFGFFEEDEGEWLETVSGDHTMEIGIGRIPATTKEEAQAVVEKIIYYRTSPNTLGTWKSEITYIADDGDTNTHARHAEELSELIDTTYAQYNINKILLDAFTQDASGSSETSPQTNAAIKTRIKNGTFTINYMGHGNELLLAEEEIFTFADIPELTNRNELPIIVTATCDFGRYDDPVLTSGAEELLLLETGGSIALLTTSRPVIASTNFPLNQAFHENIFRRVSGQYQRLGDIVKNTKNQGLAGPINRNFTLLGDPMMMPSFPELDISINELTGELDTLSALEEITFTGQIEQNGATNSSFNGRLIVSIYDVEQSFVTKGQESAPYTYELRSNAIFRGESTVRNGEFTTTFIVPKNISYQFQKGKMSLYAWDEENNIDAGGSSREFVIGGTSDNPASDNTPPTLNAFMNDESFRTGDVVGDSPLFIAHVSDSSGITTTRSGVVEGITLILGEETFNLNEFYTADPDTYQSGTIVFPLQDLESGRYQATLQVWDTHNNASETSIEFVVTNEPRLFVYNPIAYPNPVRESTTFSFEHDREDEDLIITLIVYSSGGDIVSEREITFENSQRLIEIPWNAQTTSGQELIQGIYYSRMIIRSGLDGAMKEISQKLVIVDY